MASHRGHTGGETAPHETEPLWREGEEYRARERATSRVWQEGLAGGCRGGAGEELGSGLDVEGAAEGHAGGGFKPICMPVVELQGGILGHGGLDGLAHP